MDDRMRPPNRRVSFHALRGSYTRPWARDEDVEFDFRHLVEIMERIRKENRVLQKAVDLVSDKLN